MKTTTKKVTPRRLLALTAADVMTVPVMTVPLDISIQEAARLFSESHITGAPVVDPEGRCLGVLSSSDFVSWAKKGGQAAECGEKVTCFIAPWGEMIDIEDAPDDQIRHYMTTRPIAVAPDTSIGEVAQKMVEAHIHRVLVVVDQDRPLGIVTSIDILAAIGRAARTAG
jgi:CBS domain-containing protein